MATSHSFSTTSNTKCYCSCHVHWLKVLLGLLTCCLLVHSGHGLDCSTLSYIDPANQEPTTGTDLPYCQTSEVQCCTSEYILGVVNETLTDLRTGLQRELTQSYNFATLNVTNTDMNTFITGHLANGIIDRLPGVYTISTNNRQELVKMFTKFITDNIYDNQTPLTLPTILTQITTTIDSMIDALLDDLIIDYLSRNSVTSVSDFSRPCIRNAIRSDHINETIKTEIVNAVYNLTLTLSLLNDLTGFYSRELVPMLASIKPPSDCIERFVSLQCESCTRPIPDLCHSVCQPLVLGCYSPYRRTLISQFNILWNVTAQVVGVAARQVDDLIQLVNNSPQHLLTLDLEDTTTVFNYVLSIAIPCSTFISSFSAIPRTSLPPAINFPEEIFNNISILKGSYEYGEDGPLVCEGSPKINCWNGREEVTVDQSMEFMTDDILEQNNNPVVSFNRSELYQIALSIGTPVSDFLLQDSVQQIIPADLSIPLATEFQLEIPPVVVSSIITAATTVTSSTSTRAAKDISTMDYRASRVSPSHTTMRVRPTPSESASTIQSDNSCSTVRVAYIIVIVIAVLATVILLN